MEYTIL